MDGEQVKLRQLVDEGVLDNLLEDANAIVRIVQTLAEVGPDGACALIFFVTNDILGLREFVQILTAIVPIPDAARILTWVAEDRKLSKLSIPRIVFALAAAEENGLKCFRQLIKMGTWALHFRTPAWAKEFVLVLSQLEYGILFLTLLADRLSNLDLNAKEANEFLLVLANARYGAKCLRALAQNGLMPWVNPDPELLLALANARYGEECLGALAQNGLIARLNLDPGEAEEFATVLRSRGSCGVGCLAEMLKHGLIPSLDPGTRANEGAWVNELASALIDAGLEGIMHLHCLTGTGKMANLDLNAEEANVIFFTLVDAGEAGIYCLGRLVEYGLINMASLNPNAGVAKKFLLALVDSRMGMSCYLQEFFSSAA